MQLKNTAFSDRNVGWVSLSFNPFLYLKKSSRPSHPRLIKTVLVARVTTTISTTEPEQSPGTFCINRIDRIAQGRDVAKASGYLAKTDAIDAKVLAHFGQAIKPQLLTVES